MTTFGAVKEEEEVLGCSADAADSPALSADIKSSVTISSNSPRDENVPPAGRKRTHSESLRPALPCC